MFRRPINLVFSTGRMTALTGRVRELADGLLGLLVAQGEFDYTKDFAEYFAAGCFSGRPRAAAGDYAAGAGGAGALLPVPGGHGPRAGDEVEQRALRHCPGDRRGAQVQPARPVTRPGVGSLAGRRAGQAHPGRHGGGLPAGQFLSASQAAPQAVLGSIAVHLARDQDLQGRLRQSPELVPAAVEEFLRLYSPYRVFARTAVHDVEIGGRTIPAGDPITMNFPSANRDEDVFDRPDEFIIDRPNRHIAFGRGPHRCPAAALARLELQIGTTTLLEKTERFELAGDVVMTDWLEFGPASTPLRVDAARS